MFILYVISLSVTGRTQLYYFCEVSLEKKKKKKIGQICRDVDLELQKMYG